MCVGATVVSGLSASNFQPCDFVVIQGVGAFGLYACAFTKQLGAKTVIAIDKIDKRLELAKQFGADFVININSNPDHRYIYCYITIRINCAKYNILSTNP